MSDVEHELEGPDVEVSGTGSEGNEGEIEGGVSEDGSLGPGEADLSADEDEGDEGGEREGPGLAGAVALAPEHLMGALEALILVSDKPVPAVRLARLTRQEIGLVKQKLRELADEYEGRGIVLDEIAGGFQFRTSARYAPFVRNLVQQKPTRLSRAQLEVLAIIAYRQPVTRPEVEDVRGVDSGSALKVLLERDVIKIIGKKDEAGRPLLYGTTSAFLELFGLKNLRDLPTLKEFADLTPESRDIYERRVGEPMPSQGMNLDTHYEAPPDLPFEDDDAEAESSEATEPAFEHAPDGEEQAHESREQRDDSP